MANHNYSQYSNNKKNKTVPAAKTEETLPAVNASEIAAPEAKMTVDQTPVVEPFVETVETKEVPEMVSGTVANCTKLNVRTKPSLTADVVTVIAAGEKVTINVAESNREWFCVAVDNGEHGYNGYCMKKFVTAKL